jgi:predicted peptidase
VHKTLVWFAASAVMIASAAACSSSGDDGAASEDDASTGDDASTSPTDATTASDAGSKSDANVVVDAGFQPQLDAAAAPTRFKAISKDATTAPNGYWEYLPPGYDGSLAAPLMVFWHGVGEDGNGLAEPDGGGDLHLVPDNGPPKLIKANEWPNSRPFIVLSPQHSGAGTCPTNDEIDAFITWAMGHYTVDDKRIYLTGLSCGAIGSWSYIDKYRDKVVAATLLISGDPGNIYNDDGCGLVSDLALWSVHGSADPTVNPSDDETTMPKFIACPEPRDDVKFDLIDGGVHDVWTKTYDLSYGLGDVYQWMLDHPKN